MVKIDAKKTERDLILSSNVAINQTRNVIRNLSGTTDKKKAKLMASAQALRLALKSYFKNHDKKLQKQILGFFDIILEYLSRLIKELHGSERNDAGSLCDIFFSLKRDFEIYINNLA